MTRKMLLLLLFILAIGCSSGKSSREASQQEFLADKAALEVAEKDLAEMEALLERIPKTERTQEDFDRLKFFEEEQKRLKDKVRSSMNKATR